MELFQLLSLFIHCQQGQILLIADAVPKQDHEMEEGHPGSRVLGIWRHRLCLHCTEGLCPCFTSLGSPTQRVCAPGHLPSHPTSLPHGNALISYSIGRQSEGWTAEMYWEGCKARQLHCCQKQTKAMQWIDHVNSLQIPEEQKSEGRHERDEFDKGLYFACGATWEPSPGAGQPHEADIQLHHFAQPCLSYASLPPLRLSGQRGKGCVCRLECSCEGHLCAHRNWHQGGLVCWCSWRQ